MRLLFLFLVLVNGLIYYWFTTNQQSVNAAPAAPGDNAPKLVLLSESDRDFSSENIDAPTDQVAAKSDPRTCFTLGPFMNQESILEASEKLLLSGYPFTKRASEKKEQIGYWVYLPPFATLDAAQKKAQEFKLLGDKHYYVIKPPSDYAYGIALGVFKDRANAEKRHRQIKNLGYNARLEGRFRQNPVYWLDYVESDNGKGFDNSELPGSQIYSRACETTVADGQTLP